VHIKNNWCNSPYHCACGGKVEELVAQIKSIREELVRYKKHLRSEAPMNILDLDKDALLELALKQAAELDQLRPKPPKFKRGQVVYFTPLGLYTKILRTKVESSQHWYSHRPSEPTNPYGPRGCWFPEDKLVALSATDINGEENPDAPSAGQ
jgi:hypothetical protein